MSSLIYEYKIWTTVDDLITQLLQMYLCINRLVIGYKYVFDRSECSATWTSDGAVVQVRVEKSLQSHAEVEGENF